MNKLIDITGSYYKYIESKKDNFKLYNKIFNNIDYDYFSIILLDDYKRYYFEKSYYSDSIPDYVRKNIKKFMKKTYNVSYYIDGSY